MGFPENHVFGDEIGRPVVDGALGAELDTGGAFGVGPGGGEHPGAPGVGDLDRRGAYARGAAVDQETFAALEAARALQEIAAWEPIDSARTSKPFYERARRALR